MTNDDRAAQTTTPDWQVIGVLADGDGLPEFSYTIGLHERGLPELFFWEGPSGGEDPGDDWRLRDLERGLLLNRWARELIAGRLAPGVTWVEEMDFGLTHVTFTCGELVDPLEVEALMLAPWTKVMPIRYELRRDPLRQAGEVDDLAAAEIRAWTTDVVQAQLARGRGQRLPASPYDTSSRQQFGPATSLVEALRSVVCNAEPNELTYLIMLSITLDMRGMLRAELAIGATRAHARAVGLHRAVEAADRAAMADVRRLMRDQRVRKEFRDEWRDEGDEQPCGCFSPGRGLRSAIRCLENAVAAAYTAAVVVDVLTDELRTAALAPVLTPLTDGTMRRFWCDPGVSEPALLALRDLPTDKIRAIVRGWRAMSDCVSDVHVVALMGAGDVPPSAVLLAGTPTLARVLAGTRGLPDSEAGVLSDLRDVARAFVVGDLSEAVPVRKLLEP